MNKICKILLSLLISITVITLNPKFVSNIKASNNGFYDFGCATHQYEVSWVNDYGSFDTIQCFDDFASAKTKMYELGNDYVVRHTKSESPMQIVAVSSGIGLSYPWRLNSETLDIFQTSNFSGAKTYVTRHIELATPITESYDGNGNGTVFVNLTGFGGYVKLKGIDLVPMKMLNNKLKIWAGGHHSPNVKAESPFYFTMKQSHFKVIQNGNYKDLVYYYYQGWQNDGKVGKEWISTVGPAADWMQVGATYYSHNGYDYYTDSNYKNLAGTYYNYYQFLPFRSKTNLPASAFNKYLNTLGYYSKPTSKNINDLTREQSQLINEGEAIINAQNIYGVNALMLFSLACLESGHGRSTYAVNRNNLFGWDAVDSNPDNASYFPSVTAAFEEMMAYNLRRYMDPKQSAVFFGPCVGNKGTGFNVKYASDPYWGYKIASIAYKIDKVHNNENGNLSDFNNYSLYVTDKVTSFNLANNSYAYNTETVGHYNGQFPHIVLSMGNSQVKVQSSAPVVNGSLYFHRIDGNRQPAVVYDFNNSVVFANPSTFKSINSKRAEVVGDVPTGDFVFNVSSLAFKDGKLEIIGEAYRPGIYVNEANKVKNTVKLCDEYGQEIKYDLTSSVKDNFKVSFSGSIDLSLLNNGSYYFYINTEYSQYSQYNSENVLKEVTSLPEKVIIGEKQYELKIDKELLFISVSDKLEEPEVVPSPNPDVTPLPKPENPDAQKIDKTIRQNISNLSYVDSDSDNNLDSLYIEGTAFIATIDASDASKIKHTLIFTNTVTNEIKEFTAKTVERTNMPNIGDGLVYKYIDFEASIPFSDLSNGNYTIKIRVDNGAENLTRSLFCTHVDLIPTDININGSVYKLSSNSIFSYSLEFSIMKNEIDFSLINKPTYRSSWFDYNLMKIENDKLVIDGYGWIYNTFMDEVDNPEFKLMLVDNNGKVTLFDTVTKACKTDYAALRNSKFSVKNACFDADIDLTNLENGEYDVYLSIKTKSNYDVFNLIDIYQRPINSITNSKDISLNINPLSFKYNLVIKDLSNN